MVYIKGGEDYPGYSFDEQDPVRLGEVVAEHHGRPAFYRTMAEIDDDIDMAMRAHESQQRSLARRGPKRYESQFVVEYLDELDDTFNQIGKIIVSVALNQISLRACYGIPNRAGDA